MRLARFVSRGRWVANRLRGMTVAEILARIGDERRRRLWRRRPIGWGEDENDAPLPGWPVLRTRLASVAGLPSVGESRGRLETGQLSFLGRDWPVVAVGTGAGPRFWLHDPISGGRWPGTETPGFAVDVRSTSDDCRALGDVKFVWEPNRLQILHPLAASLAAVTEPARAAARTTAVAILRDWADANPPYGGVNWVSGIEMALRLVGVALLCAATPADAWEPADRRFLRRFVAVHATWLAAFPSRHSSANNHLIAEGLGLLLAGFLMPDRGAEWHTTGRRILEEEAERQILADGVGAEQSPTYQAFTMEMLAFAVLMSREAGRPLAPIVVERLVAGAGFLRALMDDAGNVPAIGDDDEGRVIGQPPDREPRYVASVVAAVAGLTVRPELMPPARDPHLRDGLFAVEAAPAPLTRGRKTFRDGGYTTSRERIGGRNVTLVFDHGPLGYLSLCAHGHADALSIWMTIDDQPIFVDAGTYLYFAGGARRTRLRESLVHNTVSLDGASQSIAAPGFSWVTRTTASINEDADPEGSVTGSHDGYERRFGVRHERRVAAAPGGYLIEDRLAGAATARLSEIRFLAPPELTLTAARGSVLVAKADEALCHLVAPVGFTVSISAGDRSPRFGELAGAHVIAFTGALGASGVSSRIDMAAVS